MNNLDDEFALESLLRSGIQKTKDNTCKLTQRQTHKIQQLKRKWDIHQLDATWHRCMKRVDAAWENLILKPSLTIVGNFLKKNNQVLSEIHFQCHV
ncbi:hypothetical protein ACFX1T_043098 [Malus domestica]